MRSGRHHIPEGNDTPCGSAPGPRSMVKSDQGIFGGRIVHHHRKKSVPYVNPFSPLVHWRRHTAARTCSSVNPSRGARPPDRGKRVRTCSPTSDSESGMYRPGAQRKTGARRRQCHLVRMDVGLLMQPMGPPGPCGLRASYPRIMNRPALDPAVAGSSPRPEPRVEHAPILTRRLGLRAEARHRASSSGWTTCSTTWCRRRVG